MRKCFQTHDDQHTFFKMLFMQLLTSNFFLLQSSLGHEDNGSSMQSMQIRCEFHTPSFLFYLSLLVSLFAKHSMPMQQLREDLKIYFWMGLVIEDSSQWLKLCLQVRTSGRYIINTIGEMLAKIQFHYQQHHQPCFLYLSSEVIKVLCVNFYSMECLGK